MCDVCVVKCEGNPNPKRCVVLAHACINASHCFCAGCESAWGEYRLFYVLATELVWRMTLDQVVTHQISQLPEWQTHWRQVLCVVSASQGSIEFWPVCRGHDDHRCTFFRCLPLKRVMILCNVGRESLQDLVSHYTSAAEGGCVVIVGHFFTAPVVSCCHTCHTCHRVLVALSSRCEVTVTAPTIER